MVARLCCFFATFTAAAGYAKLHMVDLQAVVCPEGNGYFDVDLASGEMSPYHPYIVTFLRSSNLETTISYELRSSFGPVSPPVGQRDLRLTGVPSARRLVGSFDPPTNTFRQEGRAVDALNVTTGTARKLSGRRRGGSSSGRGSSSSSSSSRSRSTSSYSSSSRSRSTSSSLPRRRSQNTNSPAYRRRGAPTSSNTGPTYSSVPPGAPASHNRFQTSSGSGYGYGSPSSMQSNYGGSYPASSPSYGYSGTSSYRPGSTGTIVAAAGAGAVVGVGSYYMLSQMSSRGESCAGQGCCQGCSSEHCQFSCCESFRRRRYSSNSWCDYGMNRQYYRDDVMMNGNGFYPSDYSGQLKIRVYAISGSGYTQAEICPPSNWDDTQQTPTINSALFVTLTRMTELADEEFDDTSDTCLNDQNRRVVSEDCPHNCCINDRCGDSQGCTTAAIISTIAGIIFCICCYGSCALCAYCCWYKPRMLAQQQQQQMVMQPGGVQMAPAYAQPAYEQPAYGQPAYGQPVQVQPGGAPPVVMGTIVK